MWTKMGLLCNCQNRGSLAPNLSLVADTRSLSHLSTSPVSRPLLLLRCCFPLLASSTYLIAFWWWLSSLFNRKWYTVRIFSLPPLKNPTFYVFKFSISFLVNLWFFCLFILSSFFMILCRNKKLESTWWLLYKFFPHQETHTPSYMKVYRCMMLLFLFYVLDVYCTFISLGTCFCSHTTEKITRGKNNTIIYNQLKTWNTTFRFR